MYEHEAIDEGEVKNLADELNAIFQKTSAKESNGIEDLFTKIGKKFLNPKSNLNTPSQGGSKTKEGNNNNIKNETIKLDDGKNGGKQKKKCC